MLGFFAMIVGPRACLQAVGNHCEPVGNHCEPAALLLRNDCEPNQVRVCKPASYRLQAATTIGLQRLDTAGAVHLVEELKTPIMRGTDKALA